MQFRVQEEQQLGFWVQGENRGGARKHGLPTKQCPVSTYVGSSKNLKDLKEEQRFGFWAEEENSGGASRTS